LWITRTWLVACSTVRSNLNEPSLSLASTRCLNKLKLEAMSSLELGSLSGPWHRATGASLRCHRRLPPWCRTTPRRPNIGLQPSRSTRTQLPRGWVPSEHPWSCLRHRNPFHWRRLWSCAARWWDKVEPPNASTCSCRAQPQNQQNTLSAVRKLKLEEAYLL
jgi:hypothetical protein